MSTIRVPPNAVRSTTRRGGLGDDLADVDGVAPQRVRAQRGEPGVGLLRRDDGEHLALVGHVEGVDAEHLAGAVDHRGDRQRRLVEHHAEAGLLGQLVGHRADAAAGGVAQEPQATARPPSRCSTMPLTAAVSEAMSASMARSPRASITAMPWSPMVPESSTRSPGRTRRERAVLGDEADARRRDEEAVGGAAGHHLGVAGDDPHARGLGGVGHVGDDRPQLGDREALLEHERGREPARHRARHREVVHGAVHGEVADRAAGEAQGLHHERVGANRQPPARRGEHGAVGGRARCRTPRRTPRRPARPTTCRPRRARA